MRNSGRIELKDLNYDRRHELQMQMYEVVLRDSPYSLRDGKLHKFVGRVGINHFAFRVWRRDKDKVREIANGEYLGPEAIAVLDEIPVGELDNTLDSFGIENN